jgi:hypothetical protein
VRLADRAVPPSRDAVQLAKAVPGDLDLPGTRQRRIVQIVAHGPLDSAKRFAALDLHRHPSRHAGFALDNSGL